MHKILGWGAQKDSPTRPKEVEVERGDESQEDDQGEQRQPKRRNAPEANFQDQSTSASIKVALLRIAVFLIVFKLAQLAYNYVDQMD